MPTTQNYPPVHREHNAVCNSFAQTSPEYLCKVIDFVFLTIRENTTKLDAICKAYRKYFHNIPSFNMNMRIVGSTYAWANKKQLYTDFMHILNSSMNDQEKEFWLLDLFSEIPYLNCAKAGFVTTLSTPYGGCFDQWHLEKFNVEKKDISINKKSKSMQAKANIIQYYQLMIKDNGGTAVLWDAWNDDAGKRFPNYFKSGAEISARHIEWLSGNKVYSY
jgi:hypothetical protein|tara:strand:- start:524 stop:1180 length:657 start_codon:yes stop_codon:yes gene_type:complete